MASRFFEVVRPRPLGPDEQALVHSWLGDRLARAFFSQDAADQRHGLECGIRVLGSSVASPDLVIAAALHDVGKRQSGLGVSGRVIATIMIALGVPLTRRFAAYRDHGALAAAELEELGAPPVAVLFARHHHGPRPDGIDAPTWAILVEADEPAKTRGDAGTGISSNPA